MSYYTYFYPKDYNPDNLTSEEIENRKKQNNITIKEAKRSIKLYMIKAYSNDNPNAYTRLIETYLEMYISALKSNADLETITWIDSELNEFKSVAINHARCNSEYELQEYINGTEERLEEQLDELLILACIKTPKEDVSEYLKTEYMEGIEEIFSYIEESVFDMSRDKFMLKYFDTKKTEEELDK